MAKTDTLFGAYSVRAGARFLQGHIRPAQLTVHPSAPREPRGGVTIQLLLPAAHLKLPARVLTIMRGFGMWNLEQRPR